MQPAELTAAVRKNWALLSAGLVLGVACALTLAAITPPTFESKAELIVIAETGASASDLAQSTDYLSKQVRTFSALATRPVVLDPVIEELGLAETSAALAARTSVSNVLNTNIISIQVSDTDPNQAAAVADAVAASLREVVSTLVPVNEAGSRTVQLSSIRDAQVPQSPAAPQTLVWAVLGALGGLLVASAASALRQVLDTRVRSAREVQTLTGAPVLASVPRERAAQTENGSPSRRAEAYKQVRTNLSFVSATHATRVFAFTSCVAGEGKSTTALNVALAMAQAGMQVCLVEADLRRPSLGALLGMESAAGLTTVLVRRAPVDEVTQAYGSSGLTVLLAGERPPNPSELLASPQMTDLLAELQESYDAVVLDCAPILPVTDALVVTHRAEGAILVVGAGMLRRDELAEAQERLRTAGVPLLGTVLNGFAVPHRRYDYSAPPPPAAGIDPPNRVRPSGLARWRDAQPVTPDRTDLSV